MKYVSIDIETTGLDPQQDEILEVAMVIEDTSIYPLPDVLDLSNIRVPIYHERIYGQPKALSMNSWLLNEVSNTPTYMGFDFVINRRLIPFLYNTIGDPPYIAAGKKVDGFDLQFFPKHFKDMFFHRTIEVGSLAMVVKPHLWENDYPPGLSDILGKDVKHEALSDAMDNIRAIRMYTNDYGRA